MASVTHPTDAELIALHRALADAAQAPRKFSYDPACETLARHFLGSDGLSYDDIQTNAPELAQAIQDAVEAFSAVLAKDGEPK